MAALPASEAPLAFEQLGWPAPAGGPPSPLLCAAWADAIALYWSHQLDQGALDPCQPLHLLDLAPGSGELAAHLLAALAPWAQSAASRGLPPLRYLLCGADDAACRTLLAHPSLARHAEAGLLGAVVWPSGPDHPAPDSANPAVLLAWHHFSTLPAELHGVHYGSAVTPTISQEQGALIYAWSAPVRPDAFPDRTLRSSLLAHYVRRCNSNCLLLPLAACDAIDQAARWSGGRYLLLAADAGLCTERQLRLNACAPPPALPPLAPPLLNVHALSLAQQWQGAACWQHQLDDAGHVLHLTWRERQATPPATVFDNIQRALRCSHPDDSHHMASIAAGWDAGQALQRGPALLRLCRGDPAVLRACLAALCDSVIEHGALAAWRHVLDQSWNHYVPTLPYDDFYRRLATFAGRLGYWGLARACLHAGLGWYGDDVNDLRLLALCDIASGRHAAAVSALRHALALAPSQQECRALLAELEQAGPVDDAASALALQPLHERHAQAMLQQYRDPQIAVMTCLPQLADVDSARAWIVQQLADPGKHCYAVMHACWGLIGVVGLHHADDAGYFYFWIGGDFQDSGHGRHAAAHQWRHAGPQGLKTIYTSVFADNARSRRALDGAGFTPLALRAAPPDQDLLFLGLPLTDEPATAEQLCRLCAAIGSPIQFLPQQEAGMTH
jgi:RimJ/RimL family protein N-acetyltransferase